MKTFFKLFACLIFVSLFALPAFAQEAPICEPTPALEAIDRAVEALSAADVDVRAVLGNLRLELAQVDAECSGLSFEGEGGSVLGPIVFEDGLYRGMLSSTTSSIAAITTVEGECDEFSLLTVLSAGGDDEKVFEMEGCTALIEVSGREPWRLAFELMIAR
jgi:hypothetical protein